MKHKIGKFPLLAGTAAAMVAISARLQVRIQGKEKV